MSYIQKCVPNCRLSPLNTRPLHTHTHIDNQSDDEHIETDFNEKKNVFSVDLKCVLKLK